MLVRRGSDFALGCRDSTRISVLSAFTALELQLPMVGQKRYQRKGVKMHEFL